MQQASMSIYDKYENRLYQISKPEDLIQDIALYGRALYMNDSMYVCIIEPNDLSDKEELKRLPIEIGGNTNPLLVIGKVKQ